MTTLDQIIEISSRIEHLENAAEWLARETVHTDNTLSQTGTLICVLVDDLRERLCRLVRDMEEKIDLEMH